MDRENEWSHRTRRGRRRKCEDIKETEQVIEVKLSNEATPLWLIPSSSLLPARPLGAPLEPIRMPSIKQEAVETDVNTPESNIISSNTKENPPSFQNLLEEGRNLTGNRNHKSAAEETSQQLPKPSKKLVNTDNVSSSSYLSLTPQSSISAPNSFVGCTDTNSNISTSLVHSHFSEQAAMPVRISDSVVIKCEPRSRSSSTETVLTDEIQKTLSDENQSVKSDQSLGGYETLSSASSNKRSAVETNDVAKKIKIEPLLFAEGNAARETDICSETHEVGLINHSSSNNIVSLNTGSQMDCETASIEKRQPNLYILEKTSDDRSEPRLSTRINFAVTSIAQNAQHFPAEWKHLNLPLNTETGDSECSNPCTPNVPVSRHEPPITQVSTSNRPFKTSLLKFINLNTEIIRADVEECLISMNSKYSSTKSFSLFSSDIPSDTQLNRPSVEPVQSPPINSGISPKKKDISTDELKKIIEYSSILQSLNLSHLQPENDSEGNAVSGTEILTEPSALCNIFSLPSQSIVINNQCVTSNQTFAPKVYVKTEPLEDDGTPHTSYPSDSQRVSTNNKRSADETATEMPMITKKIKTEPLSPDHSVLTTGYSGAAEIQLSTQTNECDSKTHSSKFSIRSESGVVEHKNSVSVTENISRFPFNNDLNINHSDEAGNQSVISEQSFSQKIRVKTEPLDHPETSTPDAFQRSSKTSKGFAGETASDMHQMTKMKTVPEPLDHSVLSVGNSKGTIANISINCPSVTRNVTSISNKVSVTESIVQSSGNCSSPVSDSKSPSVTRNVTSISNKVSVTESIVQSSGNCSSPVSGSKSPSVTRNVTSISNKVSVTESIVQSSGNCSSPVSGSKNSKSIQSRAAESIASNIPSYLHLVPHDKVGETASGTDNARNSSRISKSAVPSAVICNNMPAITSQPDAVVTTKDGSSSKRIPVVNKFQQHNDTELIKNKYESSNSGVDRNSRGVNNLSTCDEIDKLRCTRPKLSSNNETTKGKIKLTPKEYLKRQVAPSARDPRLHQNINYNFPSQASFPDDSVSRLVQSAIVPVANQQNQNFIPISHGQNGSDASSIGNRRQEPIQNFKNPQNPPRSDTQFLTNTPRDPRMTKNYYQNTFEAQTENSSNKKVGKQFIETNDLSCLILEWDVEWLKTQERNQNMCPPICNNYLRVKDTYQSIQEYYNTYLPLHLLNIWLTILDSWKTSTRFYSSRFEGKQERPNYVKITCSMKINAEDISNSPKREDLLLCSSSTKKLFGRVVGITERDYYPSQGCPYFGKPGRWKTLLLDILCAESFDVLPQAESREIQLQNLVNIRIALNQNDALRYMNPAMRKVVLNPREQRSLLQTISVQPFQGYSKIKNNVACILHCVQSPAHRVTIVNTPSSCDSAYAILHVFPHLLRSNVMLLVCVKDENAFVNLARRMSGHNAVLAVKDEEVSQLPPELRRLTVEVCDSGIVQSSHIALTLTSAMFFGELEGRLRRETVICMIHEAQSFTETETALPLSFKVEHLILMGRPNNKVSMHPILSSYDYDVSLFHRFSRAK